VDVDALLEWYEEVRRPLPWRETRDPYALLVSEVMLQQTQALRVVPYYERWLDEFPTARDLALAPTRDVLALWSGLGYNRRALALQRAAAHVAEHGWPSDLTVLPGVGKYTAAAVSSFAWDRDMAAVDTNVRRVITRREGAVNVDVRADELLPRGRAATFNQAMMELGATVCRPRTPDCAQCPVERGCLRLVVTPARRVKAEKFEDSDRWARGRVIASLLEDKEIPLQGERLERALVGLERDGLIVRDAGGRPHLP
jgi:A/G-specific adenine glycosylase